MYICMYIYIKTYIYIYTFMHFYKKQYSVTLYKHIIYIT